MSKRSAQEKLKRYERKIRKIKEQENKKRRMRRILDFSSSEDENVADNMDHIEAPVEPVEPPPTSQTPLPTEAAEVVPPEDTQLNSELLSALGASTSDSPEFGEAVHESLAALWLPLLRKGLPNKEDRDKLVKKYLIPVNCSLLQSPKLNSEIAATVSEIVRGRDKKLAGFQQMLGVGISAINRAMDTLLRSDDKIEAIKYLSDGCRLLSDLHYSFTKDRIKLVIPSLEKNILHVIHDTERDDTLFGNALGEKIKACKAIEKQGQQIRKTGFQNNKSAAAQPSTSRPAQGNWTGPPRYQSNRGGRGGQQRPSAKATRRPFPSVATQQPPMKNFNQPRNRANTAH